jgi:TonB family protein
MKTPTLLLASALSLFSFHSFADYSTAKYYEKQGNVEKYVAELSKIAKLGHVDAQFDLATAYLNGQGIEKDINQAYAWYLLAKDFGHPEAQDKYRSLRKLVPSRREAKEAYIELKDAYGKKLHDLRYAPITKHTNFFPERAKLIEKVEPEIDNNTRSGSKAWVTVGYNVNESGVVEDSRILASFPKGVIDEPALEAVKQWKFEPDISPTGEPRRIFDLVTSFTLGSDNSKVNREFQRALDEYKGKLLVLAIKGNSVAQNRYALMLEHGVIEATSDNEHIDWYYKAAINGNHDAQMRLMHCFENGEGCQPDEEKAFNWLKLASESGNERAQYQLAMTMLNYGSIHYDVHTAADILKTAAHNQYLPAMIEYSRLLAFSDVAELRDAQNAIKYAELARAVDNQHPVLLSVLGTAHSELGRVQEGQQLLQQALNEANNRSWPAQNYIKLIELSEASMMADRTTDSY